MSAAKKTHQEPEGVQEAVDAENTGSPAGDNTASAETGAPSTTDEEITLPSPEEYEALMKELEEAQQKAVAFQDQYLRARAETDNVRRRSEEEISKVRKFAVEGFAESLIPVRDSLEAALEQPDQSVEALTEGVETTLRQLDSAFKRHQLSEVAPEVGEAFDPHVHQAISNVPSEQKKGTIAQVLQKGYVIADRVLRPALVMVSSGAPSQTPEE